MAVRGIAKAWRRSAMIAQAVESASSGTVRLYAQPPLHDCIRDNHSRECPIFSCEPLSRTPDGTPPSLASVYAVTQTSEVPTGKLKSLQWSSCLAHIRKCRAACIAAGTDLRRRVVFARRTDVHGGSRYKLRCEEASGSCPRPTNLHVRAVPGS